MVSVAQGQSTGLWPQVLGVRIPSLTPDEILKGFGVYKIMGYVKIEAGAPVAQWIEQRIPGPRVGGSNPLRRAIGPLAQLAEQLTLNQ